MHNGKDSKRSVSPRSIVFVLSKADKTEGYWPKLVSGTKPNFVKTDFSRWKDEDEEDEAAEGEGNPFGNMNFQDFGGQGGNMMGNLPGMMGGMDMSALSGMGGMPGGNMMNMNMEELVRSFAAI